MTKDWLLLGLLVAMPTTWYDMVTGETHAEKVNENCVPDGRQVKKKMPVMLCNLAFACEHWHGNSLLAMNASPIMHV